MANTKVFSDLKSGRCSSVVEARLLRFWEARNVKRGGELMWMDLLMVDVNGTMMQASIGASRIPRFRERLTAGTMFSISGFDVSGCAQNYRLTDSLSLLLVEFTVRHVAEPRELEKDLTNKVQGLLRFPRVI
ncbi:hypothetical protein Bca52824_033839 [Brassica carinata]|uniref:Replication protein A 70 kDa DNA-binding subunit B/D first OB fold domain-containing protein n=1 Tax=Brassica carinata TaxID=52824 RepID=A0A8X7SFB9_BRACI|nr:hypothetical protein Bca52824_033839 [Brassica carinata]